VWCSSQDLSSPVIWCQLCWQAVLGGLVCISVPRSVLVSRQLGLYCVLGDIGHKPVLPQEFASSGPLALGWGSFPRT
jgi:hypothetical protein